MYDVSEQDLIKPTKEEVEGFLASLGLLEYFPVFVSEGFDTIQAIGQITEDDLQHMQVKRGHRRILQSALGKRFPVTQLVDSSGSQYTPDYLSPFPGEGSIHNPHSELKSKWDHRVLQGHSLSLGEEPFAGSVGASGLSGTTSIELSKTIQSSPKPKRKYRRHPKPDKNAPEKPSSAYVMFTNAVREELKGRSVSFAEIAQIAGERWKNLNPVIKGEFEQKAAEKKAHWISLMRVYKTTAQYAEYRDYLQKFKETQQRKIKTIGRHPKSSITMDLKDKSVATFDSQESNKHDVEKYIRALRNDDWTSQLAAPASASPSERSSKSFCSTTNECFDDASECYSPDAFSDSCQLPPLLSNNPRTPPTIPHLHTLDEYLSEAQTYFFKSQSSLNAYYG